VLADWRNAPTAWISLEMDMVAREYAAPTRAARCYALLAAGINDALLVADAARSRGMDVSDDAVVAAVAEHVMGYNHPLFVDLFHERATQARWVEVWSGRATVVGVEAGQQIGNAVADRVIAWAQHDGAENFTAFADPVAAPGVWRRTPPKLASALDPGWGNVRPIAIPSAASMVALAPPAWESAAFKADRGAFAQIQLSLSDMDRALALKWAAGAGSMTPAGMWLKVASDLIARDHLDAHRAAAVYATLAVAMHDGFIACWHSKYTYLVARPITWMQETDTRWNPLIATPPFPSYPSGHATVSGAASVVLSAFFPQEAPHLREWAEDAAWSRVVGGIHWPLDGRGGLAQGRQIGAWIMAHVAV
jgi:membrane-associated phospholipid phosphatase